MAVVVVAFAGLLEATAVELAVVLAALHAGRVLAAVETADMAGETATEAGAALVSAAGAGVLLALGSEPSVVLILATASLQDVFRAAKAALVGRETDGDPTEEESRRPTDRAVLAALEDGPRIRRELWEAVDADARAIDEALDRLRAERAVERAGSEYRIAPDAEPGLSERLRSLVPGREPEPDRDGIRFARGDRGDSQRGVAGQESTAADEGGRRRGAERQYETATER